MLLFTREQLESKKVTELKEIAKGYNLKGLSKFKKAELIDFIKSNEPNSFGNDILYILNDSLNVYSITNINYMNLNINELTTLIKEHVQDKPFSNQVMNEKELKAFYRAGFRVNRNESMKESEALELLKDVGSINMRANTTTLNLVKVDESNQAEEVKTTQEVTEKEITITQEDTTEQTKINNNIYWYSYRLRGFSLGYQPSGHIKHNDSIGRHGIVAYDRPLTEKEINAYELEVYSTPVQQTTETTYQVANKTFSTYEEASTYCELSDFDPSIMIQVREETLKESAKGTIETYNKYFSDSKNATA